MDQKSGVEAEVEVDADADAPLLFSSPLQFANAIASV